jgi:hypothetical protein
MDCRASNCNNNPQEIDTLEEIGGSKVEKLGAIAGQQNTCPA